MKGAAIPCHVYQERQCWQSATCVFSDKSIQSWFTRMFVLSVHADALGHSMACVGTGWFSNALTTCITTVSVWPSRPCAAYCSDSRRQTRTSHGIAGSMHMTRRFPRLPLTGSTTCRSHRAAVDLLCIPWVLLRNHMHWLHVFVPQCEFP
jgi:hypothetical protein